MSSTKRIAQANRDRVLNTVRRLGRASVDDLVRLTGRSQPTIMKWVGVLEEEGYLRREGYGQSTGGRRPALFVFDARRALVVGLAVEIPNVEAALLDLAGTPVRTDGWTVRQTGSGHETLSELVGRLETFLASSASAPGRLASGGLAFSGFIDHRAGVSIATPRLSDWHAVPVRDAFEQRFGVPFVLNHHIDALTLAESSYGAARDHPDALFFDVGFGLGVRVVKDGLPVAGAFGNAGLIGHTTVVPDGRTCVCGNRGCLEEYVSGRALLRRFGEEGADDRDAIPRVAGRLFDAWSRGEPEAVGLVSEMLDFLAIGIANAINVFDLPVVVVNGFVTQGGEPLRRALIERCERRLQATHASAIDLIFASEPRNRAGPAGAALFALRHRFPFLDPLAVPAVAKGGDRPAEEASLAVRTA